MTACMTCGKEHPESPIEYNVGEEKRFFCSKECEKKYKAPFKADPNNANPLYALAAFGALFALFYGLMFSEAGNNVVRFLSGGYQQGYKTAKAGNTELYHSSVEKWRTSDPRLRLETSQDFIAVLYPNLGTNKRNYAAEDLEKCLSAAANLAAINNPSTSVKSLVDGCMGVVKITP